MSKINLAPDASGSGIFTIASPNSNTNRTLTLPDDTGTIVTNSGNQTGSFTTLNTSGAVVFNDAGADVDFRVEGDTNANLLFVDAGNDRVGVGTGSPGSIFEVQASVPVLSINGTTTDAARGIEFQNSGTTRGSLKHNANSGETSLSSGDGGSGYYLTFKTDSTERMRIDSSGNVLVKKTSLTNTGRGIYLYADDGNGSRVGVSGDGTTSASLFVGMEESLGTAVFVVKGNGDVVNTNNSYGPLSDIKLKKDIVDAGSQWDDLKAVRIRKFRFKNDVDGVLQIGVIAQELEEVSPGLVSSHPDFEEVEIPVLDDEGNPILDDEGNPQVTKEQKETGEVTKSVKATVLYMKAVKALQEAMERIETLEAKVAALENA